MRFLRPDDLPEFRRMRRALWPDCEDHEADALLAARATRSVVVVHPRGNGGLGGFAEMGLRPWAEGCVTSPVAYLEGLWVDPDLRRSGVAGALVQVAEAWARARGLTEMASDFLPANDASRAFHVGAGFDEVEEAVTARKLLGPAPVDLPPADPGAGVRVPVRGGAARVRTVVPADWDAVWAVFHEVVALGDTYAYSPDTTRVDALSTWIDAAHATYVAEIDGRVVGTYFIKANQPGQGGHVCNAGYMVAAAARGRGLGQAMCAHSLDVARELGYTAMQYNLVVSTNEGAIRVWERMGFATVGRLPGAFRHPELGPVDALVMYRTL